MIILECTCRGPVPGARARKLAVGAADALAFCLAALPDRSSFASRTARSAERPGGRTAGPGRRRHAIDPWSQRAVLVRARQRGPSPPGVDPKNLTVNIAARPYGERTWVYLNGLTELRSAPLRARFERPGSYTFFFTPSLGPRGRVYKTIHVTGRSRQWLAVRMGAARQVAMRD